MDVIQAARELGKAIQADDRYIKMSLAQQKGDEDKALQEMIADFNTKRATLNFEISKVERDDNLVKELDASLKDLYQQIFQNENMAAVTQAKNEVESMLNFINQIITGSSQGMDPDTIEYQESCGGSCGGCSGCN